MKNIIYFDNAATTKMSTSVCDAVDHINRVIFGNPSTSYEIGIEARKIVNESREGIANILNCKPSQIIFTSGGSEANNFIIRGIAEKYKKNRNKFITSNIEHKSVINVYEALRNVGYNIRYLDVDSNGYINLHQLENQLDNKVSLVSIMFSNSEIGTIQNIKEISNICHKHNVFLHSDCVQAIGHHKIDVDNLGLDFISASAHKFNGPKGVGFAYISEPIPPLINGGGQENGLRAGTENVAGIYGMYIALKENYYAIDENKKNIMELKADLSKKLRYNGFFINARSDENDGNILSVRIPNVENEALINYCSIHGLCISAGSACSTGSLLPSQVLLAVGLTDDEANSTIRISLSKNNTHSEIEKAVKIITDGAKKLNIY